MAEQLQAYPAEPPGVSSMSSLGDASYLLIRQFQFPDTYAAQDELVHADSDRCSMWDYEHAQSCFKRHTGTGDQGLEYWAKTATDAQIMAFLADILKKPEGKGGPWTGYRILGTVHRGNGYAVWTLELFRKHPKSDTRVYTGPRAPNVLPGKRRY